MTSIAPTRPAPPTREQLLAKAVWTVNDVCSYFDTSDESLGRWRDADGFPAPRGAVDQPHAGPCPALRSRRHGCEDA